MDVLRDFAYAKVVSAIAAGSPNDVVSIRVDSFARLPSNPELAAGEFWMTIESDLPTGAFEIVRVLSTNVSSSGGIGVPAHNDVVVLRGQDGTAASAHPAGVYMKASITAAMWGRLFAYRRYIDLGNLALVGASSGAAAVTRQRNLVAQGAGVAQLFTDPAVFRGVSAGNASGSTVVAGAMVFRGQNGASHGVATAQGRLAYIDKLTSASAGHGVVTGAATVASSSTNYSISNSPASYSDNFNRADNIAPGTLSSGNATWTEDTNTDWQITSNTLTSLDSGTGYCRITTGLDNFTMQATCTPGRFTGIGIKGTMSGGSLSATGYALILNTTGQYACWKNGSLVTPTTGAQVGSLSAGAHVFAVTFLNGLVTYKIDGTTVCTFQDSSPLAATRAGFIASSLGTGTFDDMTITPLDAGTIGKATVTASFTNLGQSVSSGPAQSIDTFSRPDGALTSPYTAIAGGAGTLQVTNRTLAFASNAASNDAGILVNAGSLAQTVGFDFVAVGPWTNGNSFVSIWLRYGSATDRILAQWSKDTNGKWTGAIYVYAGSSTPTVLSTGTTTQIGSLGMLPRSASASIDAAGNISATLVDDTGQGHALSGTDNTRTSTQCGVQVTGNGTAFDNLATTLRGSHGAATVAGSLSFSQPVVASSFIDSFNRSDRTLNGDNGWTAQTGLSITSNKVVTNSNGAQMSRASVNTRTADYQFTLGFPGGTDSGSGIFMQAGTSGGLSYFFVIDLPTTVSIRVRLFSGATFGTQTTTLGDSGSISFPSGVRAARWRFRFDGTAFLVMQDNIVRLSGTTSTVTLAPAPILAVFSTWTIDDWAEIGGPAGTATAAADLSRFADDFNRADSATTPGGKWTVPYGVAGIASNQMYAVTGAISPQDTAHTVIALAQSSLSDIDITWQYVMPGTGAQADFFISANSDGSDAVDCLITTISSANTAYIWERDSGVGFGANHSQASIGSLTGTVTLRAVRSGSTVQFYINGTLTVTRTLTNSHPGKFFGPRINLDAGAATSSLRLDNVKVTT